MSNIINAQNPFFGQYLTPHETVPFDRIKTEHYEPAILEGIKQQNAEINAIIHNPEKADFRNTIEAFEQSGELLDRVTAVFGNMLSAETITMPLNRSLFSKGGIRKCKHWRKK